MPDSAQATQPPIPVVILNWNGLDDTVECVDAMLRQRFEHFEIHLIDNGSDGDDCQQLRRRFSGDARVRISANSQNLGFTGGVNKALEAIMASAERPPAVALLNNDTLPDRDWLQVLVAQWAKSRAGIVASQMINYYRRDQLDNAGHIWLDSGEILPRGTGEPPSLFNEPAQLVGGCAGAMLISTDLLDKIGLLDRFFDTGYEDAEFGLRAYLSGYDTLYAPRARVFHKVSRSVDRIRSPRYAMRIQTNINYTYFKLAPWPLIALNSPWLVLKTVGVIAVAALTLRGALVRAHLSALRDTFRSRTHILTARKEFAPLRCRSAWQAWRAQTFFLPRYLRYFREYILAGRKTVFER